MIPERVCWRSTALLALALASFATPIHAAPPAPSPEAQELSRALFKQGLALVDAGDCEAALGYFLRSRALAPGKGNTANAVHCLNALGRYDEALELFEELVARFASDLSPENQQRLVPGMQSLLGKVGRLVITANVEGSLLVDGRPRGRLPLAAPLRVLDGRRRVRVLKDGYAPFEGVAEVKVGETAQLDAVLVPLAQAGQLRLDDPENQGAEVFVDRVRVGTLPWEGTLGPGEHVVWAASEGRGSAPTRAIVVQGQEATVRLRSAPLGPVETFAAEPRSAELRLDGVALGAGLWTGRLPLGTHELTASEPGYLTRTVRFTEALPEGKPASVLLRLAVDPAHPRWPRRPPVQLEIAVLGGFASGPSVHSDPEAWCAGSCSQGRGVLGALVGARAGFRFPFGLAVELTGGYLSVGTSFPRSRTTTFPVAGDHAKVTFTLNDTLRLGGGFIAGGLGYRAPLSGRFSLVSRAMVGVLLGGARDLVTGAAEAGGTIAPLVVTGQGDAVTTPLFVEPELMLDARFGNVHLGAGLGALFFLTRGPLLDHGRLDVADRSACTLEHPGVAACVPSQSWISHERAFRPFGLLLPTLSVGYAF